ncbi:MAG: photosynthetic reaction center subunit H [Pseudomonadota bacterium]
MNELLNLFDVAFVSLVLFVAFFFGLVLYIRREDHREGYPLEDDATGQLQPVGANISVPAPKRFKMAFDRGVRLSPDLGRQERELPLKRSSRLPGAPYDPVGDAMTAGVGPGSWAERPKEPELDHAGHLKIVPMSVATDFSVVEGDPDPRGMSVIGADGAVAGTVKDVWIDRPEALIRYLEVELRTEAGGPGKRALTPMTQVVVNRGRNQVEVDAITAAQFVNVPTVSSPGQITMDEEERIAAYFGAGYLYADKSRMEPIA